MKQPLQKTVLVILASIGVLCLFFFSSPGTKAIPKTWLGPQKIQDRLTEEIPPAPTTPSKEQIQARNYCVVMSWNVENLFDAEDAPNKADEEFTPNGEYQWTDALFQQKLYNITDIIRRIDDGAGPDILGLCEIENQAVLTRLAQHPNLRGLGYEYVYLKESHDPRGIDVGLVSRYPANDVRWYFAGYPNREILSAHFIIRGYELFVILNHWRSRLGGRTSSEPHRIEAAQKCKEIVNKIFRQNPSADILVMGDFNDHPEDQSLQSYLKARVLKITPILQPKKAAFLYNLTYTGKTDSWAHPYHYFDQIIASHGLLDKQGFFYIPGSFKIVAFPYMCTKEGRAFSFSSHSGMGYSDHFPVLVYLGIQEQQK